MSAVGYSFFETEKIQDFIHSLRHSGIADSNICTVVTYHYTAVVYVPRFNETIMGFIFAYCFSILISHYYFYLIIVVTAVVLVAIIIFRNFLKIARSDY